MVWMDLTNFTSCSGVAENGLNSTVLLLQITLWALAGRTLPALASSKHLVGAYKPSGALGEREVVNYSREDVCRNFGKHARRSKMANFVRVNGGVNGVESACPSK